jgi:outer membrane biosynthesis protein TonB
LIAAIALHLAILLSGLIVWPYFGRPITVVNATAVTLVASGAAPPPPALKAPEEQHAAAPEPKPEPALPVASPPPQPKPEPKPEPPKPAPPKPPAPAPTPKPAPTPPKTQSLDLNALSSKLDTPTKAQAKPKTSSSLDLNALSNTLGKPQAAAKGPARAETALAARDTNGTQSTADLLGAISGKIIRLWHPDCGAIGAGNVTVDVDVELNQNGSLVRARPVGGTGAPGTLQAAQDRAQLAIGQAAPFELPRGTFSQWQRFRVHFDAKQVCGG